MAKNNNANKTGGALEKFVSNALEAAGYRQVDDDMLGAYAVSERPCGYFAPQVHLGTGIYGTGIKTDFVVLPRSAKEPFIIECKWQQADGSVDEKLPFLVANIRECYPHNAIIVIDGEGFRPGAVQWLRKQIGGRVAGVYSMQEFQSWVNRGGLK